MINVMELKSKIEEWCDLDFDSMIIKCALRSLRDTEFKLMSDKEFDYYSKNEPYVIYLGQQTYIREQFLKLTDSRMFTALVSDVIMAQSGYYLKINSNYANNESIRGKVIRVFFDSGLIDEYRWASKKDRPDKWSSLLDERLKMKGLTERYPFSRTSNRKAMLLRYVTIEQGWSGLVDLDILYHNEKVIEFKVSPKEANGSNYNYYSLQINYWRELNNNNMKYNIETKKMMAINNKVMQEFNDYKEVFKELEDI